MEVVMSISINKSIINQPVSFFKESIISESNSTTKITAIVLAILTLVGVGAALYYFFTRRNVTDKTKEKGKEENLNAVDGVAKQTIQGKDDKADAKSEEAEKTSDAASIKAKETKTSEVNPTDGRSPDVIKIKVNGSGENRSIEISMNDSIETLKQKLQSASNGKISVEQMKLIFGGKVLDDQKMLKEYNINADGKTLLLQVRQIEKKSEDAEEEPTPIPVATEDTSVVTGGPLSAEKSNGEAAIKPSSEVVDQPEPVEISPEAEEELVTDKQTDVVAEKKEGVNDGVVEQPAIIAPPLTPPPAQGEEELKGIEQEQEKAVSTSHVAPKELLPTEKIKVTINLLFGREVFDLEISSEETIINLKKAIRSRILIAPEESIVLALSGRDLEDAKTLKDYEIKDGEKILAMKSSCGDIY